MIPAAGRLIRPRQIRLRTWLGTILVLLLFASAPANAAWFTRVWQTDDGLPNNQVTTIAQSQDGYLWIGTAVGLARFDGIRFTAFSDRDSNTNEDHGVAEILPARAGGLWLRTRRGAVMYLSPVFAQTTPAGRGLPDARALTMFEDSDSTLWVGYPDSIWRVKSGQAVQFTGYQNMSASGYLGKFVTDSDNHLWVAKGTGVYLFRNGQFEIVASTTYRAHLASSQTNGVWIAAGKQLFKCDTNGALQDFGSFIPADSHAGSTAVLEDHTGVVWIGTSGGLFRHTETGFEKIETSHPDILSLAEDREGNIWAGTAGGGLDRVSIRSVQLEGLDTASSLVAIQSICEDTNGVQWGATQNGVLVSRVNGRWSAAALPNAPLTNAVDCVAADRNGALWIGTRNSGLYRWHHGQFSNWGMQDGFIGHVVLALLPASNGDVWIAEQAPNAVQYVRGGQLRSIKLPRTVGRITALAEDASGVIWVGSEMGLLMKVDGDALVDESALTKTSGRSILCLYPTSDGALWLGFEGAGLGRLKDGQFSRISAAEGLNDEYISEMVADGRGWFWFGGERGIFKIRRDELESAMNGHGDRVHPVTYGQNEGLFSMEAGSANVSPYVSPVTLHSRDGRLWFPMRKSLAVVDPRILHAADNPPAALLFQVTVDGRTIASRGGMTESGANLCAMNAPLQLPPAHRHLEFDFTAIHFNAPENIRFRYQLVGFDNDWIEAGGQRSATYSRLLGGNYEFRVEAGIGDGPWNDFPTTVGLSVQPFFWQTWWFRLGALLLFTTGVIAVARYIAFRHLQAEMRLIEQRAALDKERTRIARDLHDDLGCSLNKVALTLDMTQRGIEAAKTVNGEIQHCSDMVRQVAKSVDEIVWAINPRNDTLRYMVDYISQFAVEFLHAADIPCRVDLPDSLPNCVVSPEARHNLFLVVKEALNNIARHAKATEVKLRVTATEHEVVIVISDNGRGFERAPDNASSDGLRNMRQRMDEIGGQFKLDTQRDAGTTVAFHYALPASNGNGKREQP